MTCLAMLTHKHPLLADGSVTADGATTMVTQTLSHVSTAG